MTNDKLAELIEAIAVNAKSYYDQDVLRTARDRLRDHEWIPIKDFLEDPVKGPCWETNGKEIYQVYYDGLFFHGGYFPLTKITHVIPIKKPGLPK